MKRSFHFHYILVLLLATQASTAPLSSNTPDPICSAAQLVVPGQGSFVYKYKTEVKLSVANSQFEIKSVITADANIRSLNDCNYAIQLRNVKVTETRDETESTVTNAAQRELENLVVRFRWVDGFLTVVEADESANVDHVNFIKGVLSTLQVYSPVPNNGENIVREEDVLGVCTTRYKYSQKGSVTQIKKNKDLSSCSRDRLYLSSNSALSFLFAPSIEEDLSGRSRYVCQTQIRDKKIQTVTCKTIEIESDKKKSPHKGGDDTDHIHQTDGSSEEDDDNDDTSTGDNDDDEISSRLVSIKQELKLVSGGNSNVDANALQNPVRQTLQFVPTASFSKSNEAVSDVATRIQQLLRSVNSDEFSAARFVDVTNELRRMSAADLNALKSNADVRNLIPKFLNRIYAFNPAASSLSLDPQTLKFDNPLAILYIDSPSKELVDQILQGAGRLTAAQVPTFVGLAATVLKSYKAQETNNKDADNKIRDFQRAISNFLKTPLGKKNDALTSTLAAYAHLGFYDDQLRVLASNDKLPLEVEYHVSNALRRIDEDYVNKNEQQKIRTDLQNVLLKKLQNKSNKNAVRIWAFEALFTSFIYNPETDDSSLGDELEKALADLLNEPLNQVNGFIWSALKYSATDRLCPLRGLASRLRVNNQNKNQYAQQSLLASRQIQFNIPFGRNHRGFVDLRIVFENNRFVPSFVAAKFAVDGLRHETLRLPWAESATIMENFDQQMAEYFLRFDPLTNNTKVTDDYRNRAKANLPAGMKKAQNEYDTKKESSDPMVYLHLKLLGAEFRTEDITNRVQNVLRNNASDYFREQFYRQLIDILRDNPFFNVPFESNAATAAANGLTLFTSAQLGILANFAGDLQNASDNTGSGTYKTSSETKVTFSMTLQREVASPLTSVGEVIQVGAITDLPFEYMTQTGKDGRIQEFNLRRPQATLMATNFRFLTRTSKGLQLAPETLTENVDPTCTPDVMYRTLGIQACVGFNPFRALQYNSRQTYPFNISISKDPSIQKWRIGWRFNAKDAPQYEVAVEKVGADGTYPGLGISATKTGNNFDVKVLTGMKSFNVKGTQTGDRFDGKIYSSDNREVMTTAGTLSINSDGFKLDTKLTDIASKKEVLTLKTDILPNRGKGLVANIDAATPDKSRSFKVQFQGDLYKPDSQLLHLSGGFNLGDTNYNGKLHFERNDTSTRIELRRLLNLGRSSSPSGYEFVFETKNNRGTTQNTTIVSSHLSVRSGRQESSKVYNLQTTVVQANDSTNGSSLSLQGTLDCELSIRNSRIPETIELNYLHQTMSSQDETRRYTPSGARLKIEIKTKSNVLDLLIHHRHRQSAEPSKKGSVTTPPTFELENRFHIVADSERLPFDIPEPYAFDVLSDVDFQLLNKLSYKFQYNLRRRKRAGLFSYKAQVDKVTDNHLYSGTGRAELDWDNKQKKATMNEKFVIDTATSSIRTHWDVDTNVVPDKNDVQADLYIRVDRRPKINSPTSFLGVYNITVLAPKHKSVQTLDLNGNVTQTSNEFRMFNSIAFRANKTLQEANINAIVSRNRTGDGALQTHLVVSLPFRNLPYITHDLSLTRASPSGRITQLETQLLAEPVLGYVGRVIIDRSQADQAPHYQITNELEYLRANGHSLFATSKVDVQRWSKLHSVGFYRRNNEILHKHSIGYIISEKTRKVALSLESPQLSGNPLSIIGELTIDRKNRIGKLKLPQEFGVQVEFGTPLSNVTAFHLFYNLPMFSKKLDRNIDGAVGLKFATPKITPVSLYAYVKGSLDTTLHVSEVMQIGNDIAVSGTFTGQYNPQLASQLSISSSAKFYNQEFHNSIYGLFKQHQAVIRGIVNTTHETGYRYEVDIDYDDQFSSGQLRQTDGRQTVNSDIDAKVCNATGKYGRCYSGDVTVRVGGSTVGRKGTFDLHFGRETVKLDVQVPDQIDLKFDHTHSGRFFDEDFNSKTNLDVKSLQASNRGAFQYSGAIEKEDGQWNKLEAKSALSDARTGQKVIGTDINIDQKIKNKLTGEFERKITVNYERQGNTILDWSSDSVSCKNNPSNVLGGICQNSKFTLKASNQFLQRLRQRFDLTADRRLANPVGQMTYDGNFDLDLKFDPNAGPHTLSLDVNRLREDAMHVDMSFQPRHDNSAMNLRLKANLPRTDPISIKYEERRNSPTNFRSTLKYSFDANNDTAEHSYQCDVDGSESTEASIKCKGDRTNLDVDIRRKTGKSKVVIELNRFKGEKIGYEAVINPQTQEIDAALYTLVSSWRLQRKPGRSTTLSVKQNNEEVYRMEGTRVNDREIQVKFSPANINLRIETDNSPTITIKQTSPQARDLVRIVIDRERIRSYLPSLRNQNQPANDIDEPTKKSSKPLFEIALDSHALISLSQAVDKLGSHNGLYGLDTVKKSFQLKIGDATLTVYNTQHWKTHRGQSELPESYSYRLVNNANGNFVQWATNRWNEERLVSEISHSFDGGKTSTTDFKLNRNYAHVVDSNYYYHSLGYRNKQGGQQLQNVTRNFVVNRLTSNLITTNAFDLVNSFRQRVQTILDVDYKAFQRIVQSWNRESDRSILRLLSARLGLSEFFTKYPSFSDVSGRLIASVAERALEREPFWERSIAGVINNNRLKDIAARVTNYRTTLIRTVSDQIDTFFDQYLPEYHQADIDKRIADYVGKSVALMEQTVKQMNEQWKAIFKAIDEASNGEENSWFRTLVADIDSDAYAAAADAETDRIVRRLGESSKLFISNIQQMSRRSNRDLEEGRERWHNTIRHMPKTFINDTNFELLIPLGQQPGSYSGTSKLLYGVGSLLQSNNPAFSTIRAVLLNRLESSYETIYVYGKTVRELAKLSPRRNPPIAAEFQAIVAPTGDAIDLHGNYIYLNPACDYVLAHDFADLQFSFRFINGKVHSLIPNQGEIKNNECSNTSRVQFCKEGYVYRISIPMYYGGRVNGALGDVRDRNGKGPVDLNRWLAKDCPAAARDQSEKNQRTIPECDSDDNDEQAFCENYVRHGLKEGKDQRDLLAQIYDLRDGLV